MNLNNVSFPVYKLGKRKPIIEENVSFYLSRTEIDGKLVYIPSIIDDKNIEGDTLALRRIKILKAGDKLHKLKYAIFFIGDLLKFSKGSTWFIDSKGFIFNYKKTTRVPLIFKRITKIITINTGGSIIEVEGIPSRFKTLLTPQLEHKYAGVLQVRGGYILYGLYDRLYSNTIRMI